MRIAEIILRIDQVEDIDSELYNHGYDRDVVLIFSQSTALSVSSGLKSTIGTLPLEHLPTRARLLPLVRGGHNLTCD